jgi:hypothetical protein
LNIGLAAFRADEHTFLVQDSAFLFHCSPVW